MTALQLEALGLAAGMIVLLWVWHRHSRNSIRELRRAMFDDCIPLLDHHKLEQDDVNFPVLSGTYRGYQVRLEPIIDQVVFRKLPSLWLSVTVCRSLPVPGVLDFLVRPQNTEFYSPWAGLPIDMDIPETWPRHAVLRSDTDRVFPIKRISPSVALFDEDPKMKEMLISPRGVRFVYQAAQSERSHYLVLRQPLFEDLRVEQTKLTRVLDAALELTDVLLDIRDVPKTPCMNPGALSAPVADIKDFSESHAAGMIH